MIGAGLLESADAVMQDFDVTGVVRSKPSGVWSGQPGTRRLRRQRCRREVGRGQAGSLTLHCLPCGRSRACRCTGGGAATCVDRWSRLVWRRRTVTCARDTARMPVGSFCDAAARRARSAALAPCRWPSVAACLGLVLLLSGSCRPRSASALPCLGLLVFNIKDKRLARRSCLHQKLEPHRQRWSRRAVLAPQVVNVGADPKNSGAFRNTAPRDTPDGRTGPTSRSCPFGKAWGFDRWRWASAGDGRRQQPTGKP